MGWETSHRKDTLPKDWQTIRLRIKARAGGVCEHRNRRGERCTNPGTECHHTGRPTDHRDEVLEWICTSCHKGETQRQARAAQHAKYTAAKKRTPEQHPGILTPQKGWGRPPSASQQSRRA